MRYNRSMVRGRDQDKSVLLEKGQFFTRHSDTVQKMRAGFSFRRMKWGIYIF